MLPDEVKISVQGNLLTIHGTKQPLPGTDGAGAPPRAHLWRVRAIVHPARDGEPNGIKAAYDLGVPAVTLPNEVPWK